MKVKWNVIIAFGMLLVALNLVLKNAKSVIAMLNTLHQIGPANEGGDRLAGFLLIGVMLVTLVVIVKLMNPK